jgi:AraC-like DNA-binding protein
MTVQYIGPAWRPERTLLQAEIKSPSGRQGAAIQRVGANGFLARERGLESALLLVIEGQLALSSYRGRERLERGALVIRPTFDSRTLHAGPGGAVWLQLPWHTDWSLGATHEAADVDRLLLRAGYDPGGARDEAEKIAARTPSRAALRLHWIDDLHRAILADPHLSISNWARAHRVSREGAARAFRSAYAVSPARFRLELRARRAWVRIVSGRDPLSQIALETGFADQSHMTRAVGWLTGQPPSAWRRRR